MASCTSRAGVWASSPRCPRTSSPSRLPTSEAGRVGPFCKGSGGTVHSRAVSSAADSPARLYPHCSTSCCHMVATLCGRELKTAPEGGRQCKKPPGYNGRGTGRHARLAASEDGVCVPIASDIYRRPVVHLDPTQARTHGILTCCRQGVAAWARPAPSNCGCTPAWGCLRQVRLSWPR